MARKLSGFLALTVLVVTATPASGGTGSSVIQAGDDTTTISAVSQELLAGETYEGFGYQLSATGLLVEGSRLTVGLSEVRVAVSFRNTSEDSFPVFAPGAVDRGFPTLVIRDDEGDVYEVDVLRPVSTIAASGDVREIQPGLSMRWTLGFQVPTDRAGSLTLVALDGGFPAAEWTLADLEATIAFDTPELPTVALNELIAYQPGVDVTPRATGSMVCGDPEIEPIAHLFTVTFDVRNTTSTQVKWPADIYAGPAPTAQWSDGSAAEMSLETFWGDAETLSQVGGHAVLLPPLTSATRAMIFSAPRDGRFADLSSLPQGVVIPTASGDVWLDLNAVTPTIGFDPAMCDLGGLGAPIPFAYGPGQKFDVGGEEPVLSRSAQDRVAQTVLTRAAAAVTHYFDANDQTLATFDEEKFLSAAPTLEIVEINAGTSTPLGTLGEVYFDLDDGRPAFIFLATRSESGTWWCSGGDLFFLPTVASGVTLAEAGFACYPPAFVVEDES